LPDKKKVNIDVKFPYASFIKYDETRDKKYLADFTRDVKQKIKEISSRDYINPSEDTVDFVILFVPNEMIFSFIYDNLNDVWGEALAKRVILAGPFSFAAILRMIYQSYQSFNYGENLGEIVKLIRLFEEEYDKYSEEINLLGNRIKMVSDQFDKVAVTKSKKFE